MKDGLCPDFPFLVNDWLSSARVSVMTTEEAGGYFFLLCHAWNEPDCTLPGDQYTLARLSRLGDKWPEASKAILPCFSTDTARMDGDTARIYNPKQRAMRESQNERISRIRDQRRGAIAKRWAKTPKKDTGRITPVSSPYYENDTSSPVSRLPVQGTPPVPPNAGVDSPVEFPSGFPKSETEAVNLCATCGCPDFFVKQEWNLCAARGGTDTHKNPISRWSNYIRGRWTTEQGRAHERASRSNGGNGKPHDPRTILDKDLDKLRKQTEAEEPAFQALIKRLASE